MSSKLVKKLKREMKTNPKKGAILGLTVLVAAWFWAPLFKQWFGGEPAATPPAPTNANSVATATGAATPSASAPAASVKPTWRQVAEWIDADAWMRPEEKIATDRDPFRIDVTEVVEEEEAPVVAGSEEKKEVTPEDAGLMLAGTSIGAKKKAALVGGRTYFVGDTIRADVKDKDSIAFVLAEIHAKRIVLKRRGQKFDLKLETPTFDVVEPTKTTKTSAAAASVTTATGTVESAAAKDQ